MSTQGQFLQILPLTAVSIIREFTLNYRWEGLGPECPWWSRFYSLVTISGHCWHPWFKNFLVALFYVGVCRVQPPAG